MIILEKPYVSEFLIDSIVQNDWQVLENDVIQSVEIEDGAIKKISSLMAKNYYLAQEFPLIYSNAEEGIGWVLQNLPTSNLSDYINTFRDKVAFRKILQELYPDFYYQEYTLGELKTQNNENLKFPVVIKPAVGFLNFGVHQVRSATELKDAVSTIEKEMKQAALLYSDKVINSSKFIAEELVEGEEFGIDCYFDRDGEPVILNIFQHPYLNAKDNSARIYLMSAGIMIKYMARFGLLLREIGKLKNIKNFPMHIELRVTSDEKIIPIEINPMRFAAWCVTDIAKYAWGVNVYECFFEQKRPDWNNILSKAGKEVFYYSMAEIPKIINRKKIKGFQYERFLSYFSNVLEVRRIDPSQNPIAAVVFGSTMKKDEVLKILALNMKDFVITSE